MLRKHLRVAPLLILVLSVLGGHTLTCRRSEYLNGDQCCPKCSAGSRVEQHCTEFRNTSCLDCDEGTFMNRPTGFTACFPCKLCDSGSGLKLKSCTATGLVCEPLEGFYCTYAVEGNCLVAQKHRRCQQGQYIRQKGTAVRDTECSELPFVEM
ncbi:tumor necrosis factor receptor superfamily member 14-like [Etheostoma spectabile]|uniref:tumor necrosis factor receptor superfamily member 14-like n=1 Tax=Etheostoma spectabile TaxID=54343 RepID=UPI0013AF9538|nr:tumor necrosis factor receptor superfamily member 14-like [Etheostoma spectabile]